MPNDKPGGSAGSMRSWTRKPDEVPPEEFWTPERRAAAKPIRSLLPPVKTRLVKPAPPSPTGEPGQIAHNRGDAPEPAIHPQPLIAGALGVAQPLAYPYRTIGRLFFTSGREFAMASASLISPNILLTAGHCVNNDGIWSGHMMF